MANDSYNDTMVASQGVTWSKVMEANIRKKLDGMVGNCNDVKKVANTSDIIIKEAMDSSPSSIYQVDQLINKAVLPFPYFSTIAIRGKIFQIIHTTENHVYSGHG